MPSDKDVVQEAGEADPFPDFWYLDDPPTQLCGRCGKLMPWSYWDRNCAECNDAYFAAVRESEGRFRS